MGLLTAVACAPSGLCAAVDDAGDVATTQVSPGATPAWSAVHIDPATHHCPDGTTCQAGFTSIACPAADLCVAVDQVGNVAASANPQGGADAWQIAVADARGRSAAHPRAGCAEPLCMIVACPTAASCVAVDSAGNAVTTSDPLGPSTAWVARPLGPLGGAPTALACRPPGSCVLLDAAGELLQTDNPAGGAPAWTLVPVSGPVPAGALAIACPLPTECLAVTPAGLLVARPRASRGQLRRLLGAATIVPAAQRRIVTLVRQNGYSLSLNAPQAGRLTLTLTLVPQPASGKRAGRPVTLAALEQTLLGPGTATLPVRLTTAGRRALGAVRARRARVEVRASVETTTGSALSLTRSLLLVR